MAQPSSGDRAAIMDVLASIRDAWDRGDGAAFAAPFSEDAEYITFAGERFSGRRQIAGLHDQIFATVLRGSRLTIDESSVAIRLLRPDVAVVHSTGGVLRAGQERVAPEQASIQTYVLVGDAGTWRIAVFHNTRIQPPRA